MHSLFISDLHLTGERPELARLCLELIEQERPKLEALYILGDLFEVWLGDDAAPPALNPFTDTLLSLSQNNIPVYFMRGNRDFLVGEQFARLTGCQLLGDRHVVDLYGVPTLLMHGDLLCTDDVEYLKFRAMVHDPQWQKQFLAQPIAARIEQARAARAQSREAAQTKLHYIMDANSTAVIDSIRQYSVDRLIHGHTHRPAVHDLEIDGRLAQRIVLGDWLDRASFLRVNQSGFELIDPRVTRKTVY